MLKPIELPKVEDFEDLLKESRKAVKTSGLRKSDLKKIIKKVRNER